jgi:hypothetical protein
MEKKFLNFFFLIEENKKNYLCKKEIIYCLARGNVIKHFSPFIPVLAKISYSVCPWQYLRSSPENSEALKSAPLG